MGRQVRTTHSAIRLIISILLLPCFTIAAEPAKNGALPASVAEQKIDQLPEPEIEFSEKFPVAENFAPRVRFWIHVYSKYHSWDGVIHDIKYPQLEYAAVDTKLQGKGAVPVKKAQVATVLGRLKIKHESNPNLDEKDLTGEEKRIFVVIKKAKLLDKLPELASLARLRSQGGLRDSLEDALFMSGRYLPRMEKVFDRFDLPVNIAYLPFVESGFNKNAVSKVGASGIWQFMPYTGKLFLRVDDVVDERNDPMRAAEAAARLMKQNFDILGDWPLAITAYNHGAVGVARAAKEAGSRKISEIVGRYESKTFGFASQNFYASFIAASHVAKNSKYYLGNVPRARKLEFDEFVMPDYMSLKSFLFAFKIDEDEFKELNPALTPEVFKGNKYIPVGYTIRLPMEVRNDFLKKYELIPKDQKFNAQKESKVPEYKESAPDGLVGISFGTETLSASKTSNTRGQPLNQKNLSTQNNLSSMQIRETSR